MSKIAGQKALEAYPMVVSEQTISCRLSYSEGYDKAIQDFLEKAEMYLKTRVYYNMHPNNVTTAIQDFKNYMKDESEN